MALPIYNRYLRPDNRAEPVLVRQSGFVKGGAAHTLAGGLRVNAFPGSHEPPARDYYDFGTDIPPKRAYGVDLDRNRSVREVYWPQGAAGVVDFPAEDRVGIPAQVIRDCCHDPDNRIFRRSATETAARHSKARCQWRGRYPRPHEAA